MRWACLGLHDDRVKSTPENALRVRYFLTEDESVYVDENFLLPEVPPAFPRDEQSYCWWLEEDIDARLKGLVEQWEAQHQGPAH